MNSERCWAISLSDFEISLSNFEIAQRNFEIAQRKTQRKMSTPSLLTPLKGLIGKVYHGPRRQYRSNRTEYRIESKFANFFKRPKNREDGSDFDDFWTESIVLTQSIFSKIFERTKNYRIDRIDRLIDRIDRWPPCWAKVWSNVRSNNRSGKCSVSLWGHPNPLWSPCLLYTSDAADE